jgi:hypothetical protein
MTQPHFFCGHALLHRPAVELVITSYRSSGASLIIILFHCFLTFNAGT